MPALPGTLVVLGAGRAGTAFARAAEAAEIGSRLLGRGDDAAAAIAAAHAGAGPVALLLCVPDSEIEGACEALAEAGSIPDLVGHASGVSTLDVLASARHRGAATFSAHPLQTLTAEQASLAGAWCAIAGSDDAAIASARALAEAFGMTPFHLPDSERALYHAAACISSNFGVALSEAAARILAEAGVEAPREALAPLVLRTAANWADSGAGALTGPVARGDEATVERHLEALRERAPDLVGLYEALAAETRRVTAEGEG